MALEGEQCFFLKYARKNLLYHHLIESLMTVRILGQFKLKKLLCFASPCMIVLPVCCPLIPDLGIIVPSIRHQNQYLSTIVPFLSVAVIAS